MGAYEDWQDATAREEWKSAFELSLQILNRKGSKRLMDTWIATCLDALDHLGKANLLPVHFDNLSVYGRRDELNKIQLI